MEWADRNDDPIFQKTNIVVLLLVHSTDIKLVWHPIFKHFPMYFLMSCSVVNKQDVSLYLQVLLLCSISYD